MAYVSKAKKHRLYADIWTKVAFQFTPMHTPITISHLAAEARTTSSTALAGHESAVSAPGQHVVTPADIAAYVPPRPAVTAAVATASGAVVVDDSGDVAM